MFFISFLNNLNVFIFVCFHPFTIYLQKKQAFPIAVLD